MTDRVPVSVIVPAYNGEDFIVEAIRSVHAQTLQVAEIIIVDDGSSDRSAELAERLGAVVLRQTNRGVSAARNAGIRKATQEWIAFLDQDDIWVPEKIEYQWDAISLHPDVGVVSCLMSWIETNSLQESSTVTEVEARDDFPQKESGNPNIRYFPGVQDQLPLSRTVDNPSSLMVRRDLLLAVGLFDESLRQNEDLECFLRLARRCPVAIVERMLIQHRVHSGSRSNDALESNLSFIKVIDTIRSEPDKYPPGAAEAYGKHLWRTLVPSGKLLLKEGRPTEARALFVRSLKENYSNRALIFWSLTFLDRAIFNWLLTIKRKLSSIKEYGRSAKVLSSSEGCQN